MAKRGEDVKLALAQRGSRSSSLTADAEARKSRLREWWTTSRDWKKDSRAIEIGPTPRVSRARPRARARWPRRADAARLKARGTRTSSTRARRPDPMGNAVPPRRRRGLKGGARGGRSLKSARRAPAPSRGGVLAMNAELRAVHPPPPPFRGIGSARPMKSNGGTVDQKRVNESIGAPTNSGSTVLVSIR